MASKRSTKKAAKKGAVKKTKRAPAPRGRAEAAHAAAPRATIQASAPRSARSSEATTTVLLMRLPALTNPQRDAFTGQCSDADCSKLGAQTQSGTVRATALAWAADAEAALADAALAKRIKYAPARLAWLVELVAELDVARAGQASASGAHAGVRTSRDVARSKARSTRKALGADLEAVVVGSAADTEALRTARGGDPRTDGDIEESLNRLASLVDALFTRARGDAHLKHVIESACLDEGAAAAARDAATALSASGDGVALGGRSQGGRDTPAVNLVEGRVLFEMKRLRDAFDRAREDGAPAPPLVPPPTLMRVFVTHAPAKVAPQPAPAPAPPPPAPPAPPPDPGAPAP